MKEKIGEILVVLGCLLLITLTISVAYFMARIEGEGKNIVLKSKDLKITFTESNLLSGTNIEPGWSKTSTFTVKNESKDTYKYNIGIKDLVNTFVTTGYLQYKITSADGGYNMGDFKDVPKSSTQKDKVLAYSVEIAKGATHTYSVEFKYENSITVDQSDDMGKILSGTLFIEKGTENIFDGTWEDGTLGAKLLSDNPKVETRTDFSTIFTTTNTGTLYKATESIAGSTATDVYYFAGNAANNWVKFRGFYWRIIRTNHDGSVRLLYSGISHDTTEGYIGTSEFNSPASDPMYAGYMYGTSGTQASNRTNENNSTIKGVIDTWYSNNLSNYSKYISTDAVYCNDREVVSGSYGEGSFGYASYVRLDLEHSGKNSSPTYNCTNSKDAFSGSNTEAKLTYPVGLMTVDEIAYAGGVYDGKLTSPYVWYYLNSVGGSITGAQSWWLLSPEWFDSVEPWFWNVEGSKYYGMLSYSEPGWDYSVRPVISIKSDALWSSGNGSSSSPYEIVYN